MLRVAVLTTDTTHHRYFLRELVSRAPSNVKIVLTLFETKSYPWGRNARAHIFRNWSNPWNAIALNPYLRSAAMERQQVEFEEQKFFPDGDRSIPPGVPTHLVHSANDDDAASHLEETKTELLLVYGTGKLAQRTFSRPPFGAINAHGGLLPGYRGLDTNLWAALEGRPQDMAATIHRIQADFDTGPVLQVARIGPIPDLDLTSLRYHTARLCTKIFLKTLRDVVDGVAREIPQEGGSRYYRPMPLRLKRKAEEVIRRYAANRSK